MNEPAATSDLLPAGLDVSDARLLAAWIDRHDETALDQLIARHRPMVVATCQRILHRRMESEDAAQETFIALSTQAATIRDSVGGWLRTVATHTALAQLRTALRRSGQAWHHGEAVSPPAEIPNDAIAACLVDLDEDERDLIVRLYYHGLSQAEIARDDRSTRVQVHRRLQRALVHLRTLYRRRSATTRRWRRMARI